MPPPASKMTMGDDDDDNDNNDLNCDYADNDQENCCSIFAWTKKKKSPKSSKINNKRVLYQSKCRQRHGGEEDGRGSLVWTCGIMACLGGWSETLWILGCGNCVIGRIGCSFFCLLILHKYLTQFFLLSLPDQTGWGGWLAAWLSD